MGAILVPLVLILVVLVIGVVVVKQFSRREAERRQAVVRSDVETLEYHVPEGDDPAAVLAALHSAGFEAVTGEAQASHEVFVPCPRGRDSQRAEVRSVIERAPGQIDSGTTRPTTVRFADE